jgi:polysaccharide biosynthesis transport protein
MSTTPPERSGGPAPAAYATVLRKYALLVLAFTLAAVGSAYAITSSQPPAYTSVETVVVEPRAVPKGSAPQEPDMGTEREIATSGSVAALAAKALRAPLEDITQGLSVRVPVDTHVLRFAYTSSDPQEARWRASAFAKAYIKYRSGQAKPDESSPKATVITPASLSDKPSGPNYTLNLAVALLVGLALGVVTAVVRDRFDDRLRGAGDLELRTRAPTLAAVPPTWRLPSGSGAPLAILRAPESATSEAFRYLRTKVLHVASTNGAQTLVLTSAVGHHGSAVCAANLAAALSLSGKRVVLVCAESHRRELARLLSVDNSIGLMDVASWHAPLDKALLGTGIDRLRVVPPGLAPPPSSGLADTVRLILPTLCREADLVLVDAPPVLSSADTAAIVAFTDMTLLIAHTRHSSRSAVRAASVEIEQAGGRLIGSVLIADQRMPLRWVTPPGGLVTGARGNQRPLPGDATEPGDGGIPVTRADKSHQ